MANQETRRREHIGKTKREINHSAISSSAVIYLTLKLELEWLMKHPFHLPRTPPAIDRSPNGHASHPKTCLARVPLLQRPSKTTCMARNTHRSHPTSFAPGWQRPLESDVPSIAFPVARICQTGGPNSGPYPAPIWVCVARISLH